MTVEAYYLTHRDGGRAVLRSSQYGEPLFWLIRQKALGHWEYAVCSYMGGIRPVIGTVCITVVEARLPADRSRAPRKKHALYGSSLTH
jgi:hypothetical protein